MVLKLTVPQETNKGERQIERESIIYNQITIFYHDNLKVEEIYLSVLHFWQICINFNLAFTGTPLMQKAEAHGSMVYDIIIDYFEGLYSKEHIREMNRFPLIQRPKAWMYRLCHYAFKRPSMLRFCENGFHARRRIWTAFTRF